MKTTKACIDCGKKFSYDDRDFDFPAPKPKLCEGCFKIKLKEMRYRTYLEEMGEAIKDGDWVAANKGELECLAKAILKQIKKC